MDTKVYYYLLEYLSRISPTIKNNAATATATATNGDVNHDSRVQPVDGGLVFHYYLSS